MEQPILTREDKGVLVIQFNRPEKKNALTQPMYGLLLEALQRLDDDSSLKVGLIHGTPKCFTAGNDLQDFVGASAQTLQSVFDFIRFLPEIRKPLIAAVEGPAIGLGTTLMAHCDLAYASEDALFQTPFVDLGVCPEAGASYLFPRQLGDKAASELLLAGLRYDAQKAKSVGLINDVKEEVVAYALNVAQSMAQKSIASLLATKSFCRSHERSILAGVIDQEKDAFLALLGQDHAQQVISHLV